MRSTSPSRVPDAALIIVVQIGWSARLSRPIAIRPRYRLAVLGESQQLRAIALPDYPAANLSLMTSRVDGALAGPL